MNRNQYSQKLESYQAVTVGHSSLVVLKPAPSAGATSAPLAPPATPATSFEKGDFAYVGIAEAWFGNATLNARKAACSGPVMSTTNIMRDA